MLHRTNIFPFRSSEKVAISCPGVSETVCGERGGSFDWCWFFVAECLHDPSIFTFWSFDVGSSYPSGADVGKCWIVHPLTGNVSWVQTVVRQGSFILLECKALLKLMQVREERILDFFLSNMYRSTNQERPCTTIFWWCTIFQTTRQARHEGIHNIRNAEIQEFRNSGIQEFGNSEIQECVCVHLRRGSR